VTATRFVIACMERTGSTWLCRLLNSHPSILCHGEVFSPEVIGYARPLAARSALTGSWTLARREAEPRAFIEDVFADSGGHRAVGVKLLGWHQRELVCELLADTGVRKVILRRLNHVHVFLSFQRSKILGKWHGVDYDGLRVRIDPDRLFGYVEMYDSIYDWIERTCAGSPVHHVTYEELLSDPLRPDRIVEFLGLGPTEVPLQVPDLRQSRDSLRDAIINFDELTGALAGTMLEGELSE
jgi:LPS sulfotransferase NodH